MHSTKAVDGLITAYQRSQDPELKDQIRTTLARFIKRSSLRRLGGGALVLILMDPTINP